MSGHLVTAVLAVSAIYGIASAVLFNLVFGPFAGADHVADAFWSACFIAIPYVSMYLVYRLVVDRISLLVSAAAAIVIVLIGGVMYSGGFGPNDGEYSLMFVLTPIMQLPLVIVALVVSMWQRRARRAA